MNYDALMQIDSCCWAVPSYALFQYHCDSYFGAGCDAEDVAGYGRRGEVDSSDAFTDKKMKIIFVDIIIFGSKVIFSIVIFRLYKCYIRLYRYFQVIQAKMAEKIQNYTDYFHYT